MHKVPSGMLEELALAPKTMHGRVAQLVTAGAQFDDEHVVIRDPLAVDVHDMMHLFRW